MRYGLYGSWLAAVAALCSGGPAARAQSPATEYPAPQRPDNGLLPEPPRAAPGGYGADGLVARGQQGGATDYAVPSQPAFDLIPNPLPTGRAGANGFYAAVSTLFYTQTRTVGDQLVAVSGFLDTTGRITGVPGTLVGSGAPRLTTDMFPRKSWEAGYNLTVGYKLSDGTSIYLGYSHLHSTNYHAGATLATPFARSNADLSDTYLTSAVFNFPPQFAGPPIKTTFDVPPTDGSVDNSNGGGNTYGIWNASSVQDIQYNQWYAAWELGVRTVLATTEYSRIYGMAGARYVNFTDRFQWRTVSYDISGQGGDGNAATYKNTLYQRLYGPFIGCGHEVYLGNAFAASLDVTAAGLLDIAKERAKYKLDSNVTIISNKQSRDDTRFVPSFTAHASLMWHPLEGVEVKLGYDAQAYFNTLNMRDPIGFNYSAPDPVYDVQAFRIIHGVNVGIGLFF